jgi:hypothetical protein
MATLLVEFGENYASNCTTKTYVRLFLTRKDETVFPDGRCLLFMTKATVNEITGIEYLPQWPRVLTRG